MTQESPPADAGAETRSGLQAGVGLRAGLRAALGHRAIVLVGLMGAGKTTVGRRLATCLALPFCDADAEIEMAAGMSIPDIFACHGEPAFRDGERRVIARLLGDGPKVIATGGGAYVDVQTRERIAAAGVSVWLKADHATLMRRVRRRAHRPLLQTADPDETMRRLMAERHPLYALADITVQSREGSHERVMRDILAGLSRMLEREERCSR